MQNTKLNIIKLRPIEGTVPPKEKKSDTIFSTKLDKQVLTTPADKQI